MDTVLAFLLGSIPGFLILLFALFYIRPEYRRQKAKVAFQASLERGMLVVTDIGMIGIVVTVTPTTVRLEIGDDESRFTIRVDKKVIAYPWPHSEIQSA